MITKIGTVVANKMEKTVTVSVITMVKHPLYKKQIKKTKKFSAHDEIGVKAGQKVKIVETKPISKNVHFKVMEVLN